MKRQKSLQILLLLIAMVMTNSMSAQSKVLASDIMDAIKNGENISYANVTVSGVLDFTYMEEKIDDLPRRRRWWNSGDNAINEQIESKIEFINVVFEDDVLAYIHDKKSEYTFTADFERAVTFEACRFNKKAMFKYSAFEQGANFRKTSFEQGSTFKYAEFYDLADFSNTYFNQDAVFKYTEFYESASFKQAKFDRSFDMKYTEVSGDFDIKDIKVNGDIDIKYTEVNGKPLKRSLINNY